MNTRTKDFDASKYLTTTEDHAELLSDALETKHAGYIAAALGTVAKSRGIAQLAAETGLSRQALHKALSENGNPTLDTILRVVDALGLQLAAKPQEVEHA
ncbi:putative addiction module antidote protein [Sphingomonas sp. H39-1-10]|uniref:addiction module antidote protein n=1 Tax=Sphingomonas pollutisoli TaxID=3030829 RepID=UPI0023B89F90|nr:addiction module antidote protein [Sphingomonas pollutisoli]MDF0490691.1 putative addiction module antidote protein [Sphingomonas pollutisoli]